MKDMFNSVKNSSKSAWERIRRFKWYDWIALGLTGSSLIYLMQSQEEQYPINSFE